MTQAVNHARARRRRLLFGFVFAASAALLGQGAQAETCPIPGQKPMLVVQMFFGQTMADKKPIPAAAWSAFLRTDVTPRFPDGFTVFDAYGQWRDPATMRIGRERSKVVEIAAPDAPGLMNRIQDVAAHYRTRFHQQSVGVVTMPGCGAF